MYFELIEIKVYLSFVLVFWRIPELFVKFLSKDISVYDVSISGKYGFGFAR